MVTIIKLPQDRYVLRHIPQDELPWSVCDIFDIENALSVHKTQQEALEALDALLTNV